MVIEDGSRVYMHLPVMGPAGWSPETCVGELALVAPGGSPEWHLASWEGDDLVLLVGTPGAGGGAVEYPFGTYMVKARLTAGDERVVLSGRRVRVGP
jgi:hypothetical protein